MIEIQDDIWKYYEQGNWVVITTNGSVKSNGEAVMGKGIALEAKQKFPYIAGWLGCMIRCAGNHLNCNWLLKIITFPTKNDWKGKSDIKLIEQSCIELVNLVNRNPMESITEMKIVGVYMPRPGCGNGGLDWKDVKPILEKYLDDRYIICDLEG